MGAVAGCSLMTDLHSNTQTIRKEGQRSDLPVDTLTAWGTCGEKRFPAWEATAPAHTQTMGPSSMQCGRARGRWPWLRGRPQGPAAPAAGTEMPSMKRTSPSPRRSPRTRLKRERGPQSVGGRREAGALSKRVETQSSALARGGRETRPPTPLTEARNGDACPRAALWRGPRVSWHGTGHPPAGWGAAGAPRQSLL